MARVRHVPEWLPLVAGAALSVGLGAFFYFRTDLKAAFAVFAGMLGVTIALQLEMLLQSRRAIAAEVQRDRLVRRIEAVPWLPSMLNDCLTALEGVHVTYQGTLAVDMTRVVVEDCRERLRDLQRGYLRRPSSPETGLIETLTVQASRQILAASGDEEVQWWSSPEAGFFLQRQHEAIGRGVSVQRVFIYGDWTAAHEEVAARQARLGITVLRVRTQQVEDIRDSALIIWDGKCGYIGEYNPSGAYISSRFTFSDIDIKQLENNFKMICAIAEPWTPLA